MLTTDRVVEAVWERRHASVGKAKLAGWLMAVVGPPLLALACYQLWNTPWDVGADSPRVMSEEPRGSGYWDPGGYPIRIGGMVYLCRGTDTKSSEGPEEVVYDPRDPSRCRAAKNAAWPSSINLRLLFVGLMGTSYGWVVAPAVQVPRRELTRGLRRRILFAVVCALAAVLHATLHLAKYKGSA